jgi:hypothetical protein
MPETKEIPTLNLEDINNQPYFTRSAVRLFVNEGFIWIRGGSTKDIVKFHPYEKHMYEKHKKGEFSSDQIIHYIEYEHMFLELVKEVYESKKKENELCKVA